MAKRCYNKADKGQLNNIKSKKTVQCCRKGLQNESIQASHYFVWIVSGCTEIFKCAIAK